ncbi:MAG: NAD(P)-dependent alcohol dehydrogenase [Bacteroidia bacterium]
MKAATYTRFGTPDVLHVKDIDQPVPADNEVLIQVHATTVSRTDCANISARPFIMRFFIGFFRPKKQVPGTDFAGIVERVGEAVTAFKPGDHVFGFDDSIVSSQAEYMTIAQDGNLIQMPEGLSFEKAAASCEAFHYAFNMIRKSGLEAGQKVLVNGGTGAIGSAAIQIAKALGAKVTAVGPTPHLEAVRNLGADKVIDYLTDDFTKHDGGYDFIFDAVGKSAFISCKHLLKPKGIYISSELGWMLSNVFFAIVTPWFNKRKVLFPVPTDVKPSLNHAKKLIEEDAFTPLMDRSYPLDEIAEAYRYVGSGQKIGNVINKVR